MRYLFLKKIKYNLFPLAIFLLLSVIPFYWLHGHPVGYGESGLGAFFYNLPHWFNLAKYTWGPDADAMGAWEPYYIALFPITGFLSVLASIGMNDYARQALTFSLVLFFSMSFMYMLVIRMFQYRDDRKLVALIGAIFYAFNPMVMFNYWERGNLSVYLLPFIPLVLYLFYDGLRKRKFIHIFLIALTVSFFSVTFGNPAYVIPVFMILALFSIYQIMLHWRDGERICPTVKYFIILSGLVLLSFSWFIVPFVLHAHEQYIASAKVEHPFHAMIETSYMTNFTHLFRILNVKVHTYIYKNQWWLGLYHTFFFNLIGFLTFAFIAWPFLTELDDENILFLAVLLITGFFLYLGVNSPFGFIFKWMFIHVPYFGMFNEVYDKFLPLVLVPYSILFGVGMSGFYKWIRRRMKNGYAVSAMSATIFLVCGVYVFPMWTGSIVNAPVTVWGDKISSYVEVPAYYRNIARYFQADRSNYRILSLPLRPSPNLPVSYKWKYGYNGPDSIYLLYGHDTISSAIKNPEISSFMSDGRQDFFNLMRISGIKYIVVQNDVDIVHGDYNGRKLVSQRRYKLFLEKMRIPFIRSFGKLDLYKIPDKYSVPNEDYLDFIYSPINLVFIDTFQKILPSLVPNIVNLPNFNIRSAIFTDNEIYEGENIKNNFLQEKLTEKYKFKKMVLYSNNIRNNIKIYSLNKPPVIEFKKINPTKYVVIVHNVSSDFPIILNQNFSRFWDIYPEKLQISSNLGDKFISKNFNGTIQNDNIPSGHIFQTLFQSAYPGKYHLIINGYANSWWININEFKKLGPQYYKVNKNGTYNFEFIIDFWPQRLFYIGMIISGATFIFFITFLIYDYFKKHTKI